MYEAQDGFCTHKSEPGVAAPTTLFIVGVDRLKSLRLRLAGRMRAGADAACLFVLLPTAETSTYKAQHGFLLRGSGSAVIAM